MTQSRRERAQQRYGQKTVDRRNDLYNSRAANALGRTPGGRYIVGRRREAVGQQIARQKADMAKDPNAAAIQHDDGALRAATYGGYAQAVEGVSRDLRNSGYRTDLAGPAREAAITAEAQRAARAVQTSIGYGSSQAAFAAEAGGAAAGGGGAASA